VRLGRRPQSRHLPGRPVLAAGRIGKKKAAVAVGHSILVIVWYLLTEDCDYRDLGGDFFIRRDTDRARQRAVAQLQALGYHVTLQPAA
jgi:transposase